MNPDSARRLDYYVGIPCCFACSMLYRLCGLFNWTAPGSFPKNVLFIELSEMGSTILADPAMRKMASLRDVNLHFAIFKRNSESLQIFDTVPRDNIFEMDDSDITRLALEVPRFRAWCRDKNIDTVVDLELFSRFSSILSWISGASRRVGFSAFYNEGLYRGSFLTHRVLYNPHRHISKNFISLVNALLSTESERPYSKTTVTDEDVCLQKVKVGAEKSIEIMERVGKSYPSFDPTFHRIVLLNSNSSDLMPLRRWPIEYYAELGRMILDLSRRTLILLTGSPAEFQEMELLAAAVDNARCINFAGKTALSDLPALYSVGRLMITHDSGPAHFASATDMPTFVIFGPESPALYGPLGNKRIIYEGLMCSPCISAANFRKALVQTIYA